MFEGVVPPRLRRQDAPADWRVSAELVRYHQIGRASGWLEIDGERRDHPTTGCPRGTIHGAFATALEPRYDVNRRLFRMAAYQFFWTPSLMERGDGTTYGILIVMNHFCRTGTDHKEICGTVEYPDGTVERMVGIDPELRYDPRNRRLQGGRCIALMADGTTRTLLVEVVSDTGFHLGAGLYFGFDGHHHGAWRGEMHIDGERIDDCSLPEASRRLHQIRDTVVRITDHVGGGIGYGTAADRHRRASGARAPGFHVVHVVAALQLYDASCGSRVGRRWCAPGPCVAFVPLTGRAGRDPTARARRARLHGSCGKGRESGAERRWQEDWPPRISRRDNRTRNSAPVSRRRRGDAHGLVERHVLALGPSRRRGIDGPHRSGVRRPSPSNDGSESRSVRPSAVPTMIASGQCIIAGRPIQPSLPTHAVQDIATRIAAFTTPSAPDR